MFGVGDVGWYCDVVCCYDCEVGYCLFGVVFGD